MGYVEPTAEEVAHGLRRAQRRAFERFTRTRDVRPAMRDEFVRLGLIKKYPATVMQRESYDFTVFGAKVWYCLNEMQTMKVVARLKKKGAW